jgi:hypothetical protein
VTSGSRFRHISLDRGKRCRFIDPRVMRWALRARSAVRRLWPAGRG